MSHSNVNGSVSSNGSSPSPVDQGGIQLLALIAFIATYGFALSPLERRRKRRIRRGGLDTARMIAQIAVNFGIVVPKIDLAALLQTIDGAAKIQKQTNDAFQLWQTLSDTSLGTNAEVWGKALAVYEVLKGASRHDPELKAALASVKAFMKARRQPRATVPAPQPAPAVKAA